MWFHPPGCGNRTFVIFCCCLCLFSIRGGNFDIKAFEASWKLSNLFRSFLSAGNWFEHQPKFVCPKFLIRNFEDSFKARSKFFYIEKHIFVTFASVNRRYWSTNSLSVCSYQQKNNFTILRHDFTWNKSTFFAPVLEALPTTISQINLTMIYYRSVILFLFSSSLQFPRFKRERKVPTRYDRRRWNYGCFMFLSRLGGRVGSGRWLEGVEIEIEASRSSNILWNDTSYVVICLTRARIGRKRWKIQIEDLVWVPRAGVGGNIKTVHRFFHWNVNIKSKMCENE